MADISIQGVFSPIAEGVKSGMPNTGGLSGTVIIAACILGLALISTIIALVWWFISQRKVWNIITRVHYENPTINGVSLGGAVLTKRVRFKSGIVVYMYKTPIQGYTISPELLTWTRPREHDVIVTQDKKLFSLIGINSIDVQRKKLNVDIAYPDIEMDRQDLQQHIDSKKFDDPNDRLKIIAKVVMWIFVIIGIVILVILGGKYYIDGKNIDLARDNMNLQVSANSAKVMDSVNTFLLILSKVMPESFKAIENQNLLAQLNTTT